MVWQKPREQVDGKTLSVNNMVGSHEMMATEHRTLFLYGGVYGIPDRVDSWNPSYLADQMLAMALEDPDTPIKLHIDSYGGSIRAGLRLLDIMQTIPTPVWTIGSTCYSMGAILLAAGEPGYRFVMPSAHTMLHLPSGGFHGDARQMEIQNKEMQRVKTDLVDFLRKSGVKKTAKTILKDIDREFYMNAEETIKYGIADRMLTHEDNLVSLTRNFTDVGITINKDPVPEDE